MDAKRIEQIKKALEVIGSIQIDEAVYLSKKGLDMTACNDAYCVCKKEFNKLAD